jgi:GAF domain-containing protein
MTRMTLGVPVRIRPTLGLTVWETLLEATPGLIETGLEAWQEQEEAEARQDAAEAAAEAARLRLEAERLRLEAERERGAATTEKWLIFGGVGLAVAAVVTIAVFS